MSPSKKKPASSAKKTAPAPVKKAVAKPAAKPAATASVKVDAALRELNIKDTDKGKVITRTGLLCATTDGVKAAKYLLLNDRDENIGFVYYPGKEAQLKKLVDEKVTIRGTEFNVPNWKNTVTVIQSLEKAR